MNTTGSEAAADSSLPHMPKRRTFLFEAVRLASAQFFSTFIQVCIGIATVRIWGAAARGNVEAALAVPGLLTLVLDQSLGRSLPYMIGRKFAPLDRIVSTTLIMWIGVSVLASLVALVYATTPLMKPGISMFWVWLGILYIAPRLFFVILTGFCVGVERIGFVAKLLWVREPLTLAVLLGLAAFPAMRHPENGWARIFAMDVGVIFSTIVGFWLISRYAPLTLRFDKKLFGQMAHRTVTFGIGPMLLDLLQNTPSMLLTISFLAVPARDIGNYTVGAGIAMLLMQLGYATGHVLMSRSVNTQDHDAQTRKTLRLFRVGFTGAAFLGVGMIATGWFLVPLVYGPGIDKGASIMMLLVPGTAAFFGVHTLATDLIAKGHARAVAIVAGPALTLNVLVCCLFAIPRFGVWGAAGSSTFFYILTGIGMLVLYTRVTGAGLRDAITIRLADFPIDQVLARIRRGI